MKVKELIEKLKKFDENMEVQYHDTQRQTIEIEYVSLEHEDYNDSKNKVVVLY